jgi:thiamine-phosphate diphosphorylase
VHLRDPGAGARDLAARGAAIRDSLRGRATLVVNDRLDVALAIGADGVQLGGRSLDLAAARAIGGGLALGVSVHSVDEARAAATADWLLLGTIYSTRSHPGRLGGGVGLVRSVRLATECPIIAIGGIAIENVDEVLAAGASGVAVISAILAAPRPGLAAEQLRSRIDRRFSP